MKVSKIFWGIILILAAVLLVFDGIGSGIGFLADIPAVTVILSVLCVAWAVNEVVHRRIYGIFFPLAVAFMLLEGNIADWCGLADSNIISNWLVLVAAILLTAGFSVLFGKADKVVKPFAHCCKGDKDHPRFSSSVKYIDASTFVEEEIDCNMSSCEVYFQNTDAYPGGGVLKIDCNMSSVVVHVPSSWTVVDEMERSMSTVDTGRGSNDGAIILNLRGECHMGSVKVEKE